MSKHPRRLRATSTFNRGIQVQATQTTHIAVGRSGDVVTVTQGDDTYELEPAFARYYAQLLVEQADRIDAERTAERTVP